LQFQGVVTLFPGPAQHVVQIKKYPNRRYYDASHSRHITLQEVHDLVVSGQDVCVSDSRNGDDITNLVLTQILLEHDEPKLDLFPSSMLHMMIRSDRQVLRTSLERFFGPFFGLLSTSQKQFDAYLRQTMQGAAMTPFDWANRMMEAFSGRSAPAGSPPVEPHQAEPPPDAPANPPSSLSELHDQLAALQRKVERIQAETPSHG